LSRERQNGTKIYEVVLEATGAGAKVILNMRIGLTQSCARRHPSRWHDIPKYDCEIVVDSCIFSTTLK
jgi:hypothetical protein